MRARARQGMIAAALAVLLVVAYLRPLTFAEWMQEDAWVEWASFFAFVFAGALACHAVLRKQTLDRWSKLVLLGLSLFSIFVAGEEISWGQRLLSFRPPDIFLEKNYQQEANFHNFLKTILDTRWVVLMIAAGYGVLAPFVVPLIKVVPRVFAPSRSLVPWFAAIALIEAFYPFELSGELAELMLGLVILADVIDRRGDAFSFAPAFHAAAIAGGLIGAPIVDAITLSNAMKLLPAARADVQALAENMIAQGGAEPRILKKRSVHKRVYTSVRAKYLALDKTKHYLDPWNQPYWIAFRREDKAHGKLLLYSFGPNRRRDTDVELILVADTAEQVLRGDDLGVMFEVPVVKTATTP